MLLKCLVPWSRAVGSDINGGVPHTLIATYRFEPISQIQGPYKDGLGVGSRRTRR